MKIPFARNLFILALCVGGVILAVSQAASIRSVNADPPLNIAYAHILGDGTLDQANSRNVLAMGGADGLYCFTLSFKPKNAVATLVDDPSAPSQGIGYIKVALPPTPTFGCSTIQNPDAVVETGTETSPNGGHSQGGYSLYVYWIK